VSDELNRVWKYQDEVETKPMTSIDTSSLLDGVKEEAKALNKSHEKIQRLKTLLSEVELRIAIDPNSKIIINCDGYDKETLDTIMKIIQDRGWIVGDNSLGNSKYIILTKRRG
jgi:hypothetical protein